MILIKLPNWQKKMCSHMKLTSINIMGVTRKKASDKKREEGDSYLRAQSLTVEMMMAGFI